jgi:hypothetical protein
MTGTGVVLPVRAFALGKARLAETLNHRAVLRQRWADRGRRACGLPIVVMSDEVVAVTRVRGRGRSGSLVGTAVGCGAAAQFTAPCRPLPRPFIARSPGGSGCRHRLVPYHRDDGTRSRRPRHR